MDEAAKALIHAAGVNLCVKEETPLSTVNEALMGKDKIMVFVKDDNHAISLFDQALRTAETTPSAFLFVGLIPNNLPSGHTERFKGRVFRKLAQGLMRCREKDIPWSLRIFENTDPEQTALELVRQYQPDSVYIGNAAQRRHRLRRDFRATLSNAVHVKAIS